MTDENVENYVATVDYVQNMNSFFVLDKGLFPDIGFERFGFGHFLWLFVGGAGLVLGCFAYGKALPERRPGLRLLTAGLALALELGRAGLLLSRGLSFYVQLLFGALMTAAAALILRRRAD